MLRRRVGSYGTGVCVMQMHPGVPACMTLRRHSERSHRHQWWNQHLFLITTCYMWHVSTWETMHRRCWKTPTGHHVVSVFAMNLRLRVAVLMLRSRQIWWLTPEISSNGTLFSSQCLVLASKDSWARKWMDLNPQPRTALSPLWSLFVSCRVNLCACVLYVV